MVYINTYNPIKTLKNDQRYPKSLFRNTVELPASKIYYPNVPFAFFIVTCPFCNFISYYFNIKVHSIVQIV